MVPYQTKIIHPHSPPFSPISLISPSPPPPPLLQASCVRHLSAPGSIHDPKSGKQMMGLLTSPLTQYRDARVVVGLAHYAPLMAHLQLGSNKAMASVIITSILKNETVFGEPDQVGGMGE